MTEKAIGNTIAYTVYYVNGKNKGELVYNAANRLLNVSFLEKSKIYE
jgi:hypothetical protein